MFNSVKSRVSILEVMSKDLGLELSSCGDNTYKIEDERNNGGCPFCGHNDCFKIKCDEEDLASSLYHCFSCEAGGSVIDWTAHHHKISVKEAADKLAKEYNVPLPKDYSPMQELFDLAASYYHQGLMEVCNVPQASLRDLTPKDYQTSIRNHTEESLKKFKIGYSDGGLVEFLESVGFTPELIEESGLRSKKTGRDFLPSNVFIYPHFVKGRVSHFTFKDVSKKLAYQLANKHTLNGIEFYNQDSVQGKNTVFIVEGENDVISMDENCDDEVYGIIGTIGQISKDQLNWIRNNLQGKNVVTLFDPDDAGDKYRVKVESLKSNFASLTQVRPPMDKDIDDHLRNGVSLQEILDNNVVKVSLLKDKEPGKYEPPVELSIPGVNKPAVISNADSEEDTELDVTQEGTVFEKGGRYFRTKYKEGIPSFVPISNFTLQLSNVYITDDNDRMREIVVTRMDGVKSEPVIFNSETKVNIRNFRVAIAKAADANFIGTDQDLVAMWDCVYATGRETMVRSLRVAGRNENIKGWVFRNKFISDNGAVTDPDENGIFWPHGNFSGIKAESINRVSINSKEQSGIPDLYTENTPEEREELLQGFINNLAKNLGDPGTALLMVSWMNAVAYSNTLFIHNHGFPFLFIGGTNGKGKGTIGGWLMELYNMHGLGKTTVSQLKSGVGFSRKAEYYGSLPLWIDEIRQDSMAEDFSSAFRAYYDRESRHMGARDGFGVKTQEIRSCHMFSGEDTFQDPATAERCVYVRILGTNREFRDSYQWMDHHKDKFSSIGYKWILESVNEDHKEMLKEAEIIEKEIMKHSGCSPRKGKMWSTIGVFAMRLATRYMPGFDMMSHLFKVAKDDHDTQVSETTISRFWDSLESLTGRGDFSPIGNDHVMVEGSPGDGVYPDGVVHIWWAYVFKEVNRDNGNRNSFSKHALLSALREAPYFLSDKRKICMGSDGIRRTVVTLDLSKCPDSIKNICNHNG